MAIVLETERLLLRHLELDDVNVMFAIIGDPVAMQHYPQPFSREDAANWIKRNRRRYAEYGFGLYAVVLKSSSAMIGDCGIARQTINGEPQLEVGYHLLRSQWGHGYATEAAMACMKLAFDQFGAEKVISLIRAENLPSRRVAERNGMTIEGETIHAGLPHLVYAMRRSNYGQA
jgi:RimJ/RimL family protein N-acetyltransferase